MSNKRPLLSIIIPVFNSEDTIVRTLDSAFNQSYKNIEIVVVNDGSTDGSKSIIENYFLTHDVSHVFVSIENGGLANARNIGWNLANGDYCCNLDSDDYLDSDIAKKVFDTYKSFDVCYYGFRDVDCNSLKEIFHYSSKFKYCNNLSGCEAAILKLNRTLWICQGSCIYNRKLFTEKTANIPGINQGEDLLFITSMLFFSKKVVCIEDIGVNIVSSPTSMMHKDYNESFCQGIEASKALFTRINPCSLNTELKDLMAIEIDNQVSRVAKAVVYSKSMSFSTKIKTIKQIKQKYFVKLNKQRYLLSKKKRLEFFFLDNSAFFFFAVTKVYKFFNVSK